MAECLDSLDAVGIRRVGKGMFAVVVIRDGRGFRGEFRDYEADFDDACKPSEHQGIPKRGVHLCNVSRSSVEKCTRRRTFVESIRA